MTLSAWTLGEDVAPVDRPAYVVRRREVYAELRHSFEKDALSPARRAIFLKWRDALRAAGFAGGTLVNRHPCFFHSLNPGPLSAGKATAVAGLAVSHSILAGETLRQAGSPRYSLRRTSRSTSSRIRVRTIGSADISLPGPRVKEPQQSSPFQSPPLPRTLLPSNGSLPPCYFRQGKRMHRECA